MAQYFWRIRERSLNRMCGSRYDREVDRDDARRRSRGFRHGLPDVGEDIVMESLDVVHGELAHKVRVNRAPEWRCCGRKSEGGSAEPE